jgi:hypothetical protein
MTQIMPPMPSPHRHKGSSRHAAGLVQTPFSETSLLRAREGLADSP